ncbi:unnamed protein product [Caenorhabditis nigoni]
MEPSNLYQNSLYAHLYFTGITPGQITENLDSIRKEMNWQKNSQSIINQSSNGSLPAVQWTSGQTYQQTGSNPMTPTSQNNISTGNLRIARTHPWLMTREQYAAHLATQMADRRRNQQYLQDRNIYAMQPGLMMPAQNSGNIAGGPMRPPVGQNQYYKQMEQIRRTSPGPKTPSELEHERMRTSNPDRAFNGHPFPQNDPVENRNQQMNNQTARNTPSPRLQYAMFQHEVQKCQQANRSAGTNLTGRVSPIPYVTTDQLSLLMTQYPQLFPQRQGSPKISQEQYSPYRTNSSDDSGNVSMASPTQQSPVEALTWHAQLPRSSPSQVIHRTSPILRSMSDPTPPTLRKDSGSNQCHILLDNPGPVRRCRTYQELRSSSTPYNIENHRTKPLGSSVRPITKEVPERPRINFLDPTNLEAEIASHQEMHPAQLKIVIATFMTKNTIARWQVADMTETHHFYIKWFLEGNHKDVYPQCKTIFITWYLNCKKYPAKLSIYKTYPRIRPTPGMAYSDAQLALLVAEFSRDKKLTDAQIAENINKKVRSTTTVIPMTAKLVKQWWKTKKPK